MSFLTVILISIGALAFVGVFVFFLVQGQAEVHQREDDWVAAARVHRWELKRTGDRRTRSAELRPQEVDPLEWKISIKTGQPLESEVSVHSKTRHHHSTEWSTNRTLNPRSLLLILAPGAAHDPYLQAGLEDLTSEKAMGLIRGRYQGELGPMADSVRLVPGLPKPFSEYYIVLTNDLEAAVRLLEGSTREELESWHHLDLPKESALPVVVLKDTSLKLRIRGMALQKPEHLSRLNEIGHTLAMRIAKIGELQSA